MREIYSIRLSQEEKEKLHEQAEQLGFQSSADFARELMRRGYQSLALSTKEEHLLYNSVQCVMLLRELMTLLSSNETHSSRLIQDAKQAAGEWTDKFKRVVQKHSV